MTNPSDPHAQPAHDGEAGSSSSSSNTAQPRAEDVGTIFHDLRGFLHIVETSLYLLRNSRDDQKSFDETLDILAHDRLRAQQQLEALAEIVKRQEGASRSDATSQG